MITITDAAKAKINTFLDGADAASVFRVGVSSGGCSGFSYITQISDAKDDDITVEGRIVTDNISLSMLKNATLDYVDTIGFSGFTFDNPDTTSKCGCGMSFDV